MSASEGSDCITGKVQYVSKAAAQDHKKGLAGRTGNGSRLGAYRCAFCELYHVGNRRGVRV